MITAMIICAKMAGTIIFIGLIGMNSTVSERSGVWFRRFDRLVKAGFATIFIAALCALWVFVPNGVDVK